MSEKFIWLTWIKIHQKFDDKFEFWEYNFPKWLSIKVNYRYFYTTKVLNHLMIIVI